MNKLRIVDKYIQMLYISHKKKLKNQKFCPSQFVCDFDNFLAKTEQCVIYSSDF